MSKESKKRIMKIGDKIMSPIFLLIASLAIGFAVATGNLWNFLEPLIGLATLGFAASAWWQTRKAKEAYYEDNSNADNRHVVALEVGRPISEAVKARFGNLDILIRVQDVIGLSVLCTDEHYELVARAVYSACARAQNKPIDLIVSGPNGLLLIIGQMLGMDRFKVRVWQYYNGEYQPVPRPTRDWLEHREGGAF